MGRIVVQLNPKGRHLDQFFAKTHEYVLPYRKSIEKTQFGGIAKSDSMLDEYSEEDNRGRYRLIELRNRNSAFNPDTRPNLYFPLFINPKTFMVSLEEERDFCEVALPHDSKDLPTCWTWNREAVAKGRNLLVGKKTNGDKWRVFRKDYLIGENGEESTTKPKTIWLDQDLNMDLARKTVSDILGKNAFDFPKPVGLIQRLLNLIPNNNALVLDSFAGSGTTAHAVLAANAKDGGNRKFILVECEDYADTKTAERVRRVINGFEYAGTQKEELFRERITWSTFHKDNARKKILDKISDFEEQKGSKFDSIKKEIKDGELVVTGEKTARERTEGIEGSFTFCTLGDPIELDRILSGETLPSFEAIGSVLFHMATSMAFDPGQMVQNDGYGYLGSSSDRHVWLIYKPNLDFLKSSSAALTLERAKAFVKEKSDKPHLVFGPSRFVSRKILEDNKLPLEFAPLPFALYRIANPDIQT